MVAVGVHPDGDRPLEKESVAVSGLKFRLALIWGRRWLIAGGAFFIVGIYADDVSALAVGLLILTHERISLAEQRTELEVLKAETRMTNLIYWGKR